VLSLVFISLWLESETMAACLASISISLDVTILKARVLGHL